MLLLLFLFARLPLFALVALDLRSTLWRAVGFAVVMCIGVADVLCSRSGNGYCDYLYGFNLGVLLLDSMRHLLLMRPLEEFRHESDKVPAYQLSFIHRFFWLMKIPPRGIGWSFKEDRPIPIHPRHRTRLAFIASRLRVAVAYYFVFEVARLYTRANPIFSTGDSIASQGYVLRCLNILASVGHAYAYLQCSYSLTAAAAVAMNLDEPSAWPDIFGSWRDAYTIRRFWTRKWHQIVRYVLTIFGPHRYNRRPWDDASDPSTREPKDSVARISLRLWNAFFCSAVLHVTGDIPLQFRIWGQPTNNGHHPFVIGMSASLFLLQPLGILVEEVVIQVGKYLGMEMGTETKIIGYAWVWIWLSFSAVPSLDGVINAMRIAYPAPLWGDGPTVIEHVGKAFGVDLLSVMSSWFTSL